MNRFLIRSLSTAALVIATLPAQADISFVDMFRSDAFLQNGNGNALTSLGSYFSATLTSDNANDFDSVQLTYPGADSPVSLSPVNSSTFSYQSSTLPTQTAMDTAYPMGTYQFDASNSAGTSTTSVAYASDDYAQSLPFLSGADYTNLQGVNGNLPINLHFSSFVTGSQANDSFIFLTIRDDATSSLAYDSGFLSSTTSGVTVPAGTLQSNHDYTYELIFSNRDLAASPGAAFDAQLGFDLRTQGHFTTVPAPSALATLLAGAVPGMTALLRRRRNSGK